MATNYKLDELAREAGTSARTVRYYVQRGLLPAPEFRGKDTGYGREHLARLRAIRRLQEAFFPLEAIAAELSLRTPAEIERIAEGKSMPTRLYTPRASPSPTDAASDRESTSVSTGKRLTRFAIADGVELVIADDAPPESHRLVAEMPATLQATSRPRERK